MLRNHLLRRVAAVVNFSFVRRLTARSSSHTGHPGVDPLVLFKISLLGWPYGVASERRVAEEARRHGLWSALLDTPPDPLLRPMNGVPILPRAIARPTDATFCWRSSLMPLARDLPPA